MCRWGKGTQWQSYVYCLGGAGDPRCHAGGGKGWGAEVSGTTSGELHSALPPTPASVLLQNGACAAAGGVAGQHKGWGAGAGGRQSTAKRQQSIPRALHSPFEGVTG